MFTIKIIHKDQSENLYHSVDHVERIVEAAPGQPVSSVRQFSPDSDGIWFIQPNGVVMFPQRGSGDLIYVMNENGKTVATYQL